MLKEAEDEVGRKVKVYISYIILSVNPVLPQSLTVSVLTYFLIFSSASENNTERGTKL